MGSPHSFGGFKHRVGGKIQSHVQSRNVYAGPFRNGKQRMEGECVEGCPHVSAVGVTAGACWGDLPAGKDVRRHAKKVVYHTTVHTLTHMRATRSQGIRPCSVPSVIREFALCMQSGMGT